VAEAAALLSVSKEYLYRIVQADGFPAVHMLIRGGRGRYTVPAKAVEAILDHASVTSACVNAATWTASWQAETGGGAA
jgi:excisionase family DNA binding protein